MIDRKMILYVLLGMIVFSLWNAWQADYGRANTSSEKEETKAIMPIADEETHPSNKANGAPGKKPAATAGAVSSDNLIKVKTDVLDIDIDLIGGNVVYASLPQYPKIIYKPQPFVLLDYEADHYYVAQSGLIGKQGPDSINEQAHYTTAKKEYVLLPNKNSLEVKLTWGGSRGLGVTKTFIFEKSKYDIKINYEVINNTPRDWSGQFFAQIKRKSFGSKGGMFSLNTYTGAAISSTEIPYEKISFSKMEGNKKENKSVIRENRGGWAAMQQRYFLSVWIPEQDKDYKYFSAVESGVYTIGLSEKAITVPKGHKEEIKSTLYAGPAITENIAPLARDLDRIVDYGWLWHIGKLFFLVLKNIYKIVGNWGWSIIIVTVLIKLCFYKLSESSCRSMARMRTLMPKLQALKERHGEDKQRLHQATMELYKQEKINPLNLGGCLPMLIQIPFFIALYYVLIGAVELRHAPFILWIHDLSASDPYYILPLLMGGSMLLQQRLTPSSADPAQAKMMMLMPVVFTFLFLNFPAGLVLYWLVNNLLSILQQWYINRNLERCSIRHK